MISCLLFQRNIDTVVLHDTLERTRFAASMWADSVTLGGKWTGNHILSYSSSSSVKLLFFFLVLTFHADTHGHFPLILCDETTECVNSGQVR